MSLENIIERFIIDELSSGRSQITINPEESLINSGILDSMALLKLIAFIETRFNIAIKGEEIIPENFETIGRIKRFIEKKQPAL